MKEKIINLLIEITGGLSVITLFFGIYIGLEFLGILWIGALIYWILVILTSPLLLIAAYFFLKDIHQSNLDDIEEQQLDEQIEQTVVKEQLKTSLETIALVSLIFYFLMCGVLFIFVSDLGLVNWLILLSVIPTILILGFLKDKLTPTIKDKSV